MCVSVSVWVRVWLSESAEERSTEPLDREGEREGERERETGESMSARLHAGMHAYESIPARHLQMHAKRQQRVHAKGVVKVDRQTPSHSVQPFSF